jgi:chitodextrinase
MQFKKSWGGLKGVKNKKIIAIIFSTLVLTSIFGIMTNCVANPAGWSEDKRITITTADSEEPAIAVSGNYVHMVWQDYRDGNWEIYYMRSANNGYYFLTKVRLSNDVSESQNPAIAAQGDNVHVVWQDNRDGNWEIYYIRSTDKGSSWESVKSITSDNNLNSVNPSIAVTGKFVSVVWEEHTSLFQSHIYFKRSIDFGASWPTSVTDLDNNVNLSTKPSIDTFWKSNVLLSHVVWQEINIYNDEVSIYYKRGYRITFQIQGWYDTIKLVNDTTPRGLPAIDVNKSKAHVHVVWTDYRNGNWDIFYNHSLDNGVTWDTDKRLSIQSTKSTFPAIAVNGTDVHVVWVQNIDGIGEIYYKNSYDKGNSWERGLTLTDSGFDAGPPAIAKNGDYIHIVWHENRGDNNEIYYRRSTDNGVTWKDEKQLTWLGADSEKSAIAVNGDYIHVVWSDLRKKNWEIYYKRSTDNGVTWEAKRRLTYVNAVSSSPSIAVYKSRVYVFWHDNRDGDYEIFYKISQNYGDSFGALRKLTVNNVNSIYPEVAVYKNYVHVVWNDYRDGGGYGTIYWNVNDLFGTDGWWKTDTRISLPGEADGKPAIAINERNIHVVWRDMRINTNGEIYYNYSSDNGTTWNNEDTRLTDDFAWSHQPDIAADGDNIHVVWSDHRGVGVGIYYKNSTNNGISWSDDKKLTDDDSKSSENPAVAVNKSNVHVVWSDKRGIGDLNICYKKSNDDGITWTSDTQLTTTDEDSKNPKVAVNGSNIHVVWHDWRFWNWEIFYKYSDQSNLPPDKPSNPSPSHEKTNVGVNTDLSWSCSDPEGDDLTYDIYFGEATDPPLVKSGHSSTTYNPGTLDHDTTYNWKIVAKDDHGNSVTGDIWKFTTEKKSGGGGPSGGGPSGGGGGDTNPAPEADANGPYEEIIGVPITFDGSGSTDDGTITSYDWEFGDGNTGTGVTTKHTYTKVGKYTVTLTVTDDGGKTDTSTTYANILDLPNSPPEKPDVSGPSTGTKNQAYEFSAQTTDSDNDTIRYIIEWGDGTNTTTELLPNGTKTEQSHTWTAAGIYTISIHAEDELNATSKKVEITILIDTHYCEDLGYLIDENGDGTYDNFYCNQTGNKTTTGYKDKKYLINIDEDSEWEYMYSLETGLEVYKGSVDEKEDSPLTIILIVIAIIVIVIIIVILISIKGKKK